MPRRLLYKEFEAIAIAEFSCEIQEDEMRHLTHRHDGVLRWTPVLDDHQQMDSNMIEQICRRLGLPLERFEDYL